MRNPKRRELKKTRPLLAFEERAGVRNLDILHAQSAIAMHTNHILLSYMTIIRRARTEGKDIQPSASPVEPNWVRIFTKPRWEIFIY